MHRIKIYWCQLLVIENVWIFGIYSVVVPMRVENTRKIYSHAPTSSFTACRDVAVDPYDHLRDKSVFVSNTSSSSTIINWFIVILQKLCCHGAQLHITATSCTLSCFTLITSFTFFSRFTQSPVFDCSM